MPKRRNIPFWLERANTERDSACGYCGVSFSLAEAPRSFRPSWKHIVNDARIITRSNIALCCIGCNASKGAKGLEVWLLSPYCLQRGITPTTVALVIKQAIARPPSLDDVGT